LPRRIVFVGTLSKVHENRLKVTNCNKYHTPACSACQNTACLEKIESTHGNSLNVIKQMRIIAQSNKPLFERATQLSEKAAMLTDMVAWREGEVGISHNWNQLYGEALREVIKHAKPGERAKLWKLIYTIHKNEGKARLN